MAKKYTQEEAEQLIQSIGGILVGKYQNSITNTEFKCPKCNSILKLSSSFFYKGDSNEEVSIVFGFCSD